MVTFQINKELDILIASDFLGTFQGGVDFGQAVWSNHPELKNVKRGQVGLVTKYFDKYYQENENLLTDKIKPFQEQWNKVEDIYLKEIIKLFNGFPFPKGKYIGYISSFDCNPRFLEDKTFQVFYGANTSVDTTAHELMHFIFFEYTAKHMKNLIKNLKTYRGLWWDVSEVFNNVILSSGKYVELLNPEENIGYPSHKEYIAKAKEIYNENMNINEFIPILFKLLS